MEKFTYLQSLLEHSAREAISGLTLSSANYSEAISVLKGRYGNKQKIIALHMDTLLNLESVTSQHNLTSIRRLYDQIEANIRGLRSLGVTSDTYASLLLPVVIKKIPSEIQLSISCKVAEEWTLDKVLEELKRELKADGWNLTETSRTL